MNQEEDKMGAGYNGEYFEDCQQCFMAVLSAVVVYKER
jgi:hypothetical protein